MAGNTVTLTFAGDSKSLERTFDNVGSGAKRMAGDLDKAGGEAKKFGSSMDGVNSTVDKSEGKFMGAADLLDGLGGAFGLPLEGATNMARSFGDLAGGFSSVIGPAVTGLLTKFGILTTATAASATATTGAAVAQNSLNLAFLANPIGLTIAAIIALGAAFVLAWKHSETFRDIVKGAFRVVGDIVGSVVGFFVSIPDKLMAVASGIKDAILWPYKTAFNLIAKLWNNTVGQLSFEIPSWVPGIGGKGFSMPKLPTFHQGGIVPGPMGAEVPILAMAGETVTPAGQAPAGGPVAVKVFIDGRDIHQSLLRLQRTSGALGLT